jgi:hypothetical protein
VPNSVQVRLDFDEEQVDQACLKDSPEFDSEQEDLPDLACMYVHKSKPKKCTCKVESAEGHGN